MTPIGPLLLLTLLIVGAVVLTRKLGRPGGTSADGVVRTTWWVAMIYGVVVVVTATTDVVHTLTGDVVRVTARIQPFWPTLPPGTEVDYGRGAAIETARMSQATLGLSGLSDGTRALLAGADAIGGLTILSVVVVVALACRNLRRRTPFAPVVARACALAAVVVAVGASLSQIVYGIGSSRAASDALNWSGMSQDCGARECPDTTTLLPAVDPSLTVEFWPLAVALVLAVIAVLLRTGEKLVHDTEGLV